MYKFKELRSLVVGAALLVPMISNAGETIRVYSAASMTNVVQEISKKYSEMTGDKITPVFASSSSLARQIEKGAPADIYISANKKWVDYLIGKDLAKQDKVTIIAKNELVLIGQKGAAPDAFDLSDGAKWQSLLKDERIAIGEPNSVPAGIYAKQSFSSLNLWDDIKTKTAPTNSVRVALALVERGEAKLGVVYKTDALISSKVEIVKAFPDDSHKPIVYPMVTLSDSAAVNKFATYIKSGEAKAIMSQHGFK